MMMILPLLIFVLLPKVVNTSDPDMRRVSKVCIADIENYLQITKVEKVTKTVCNTGQKESA